MSALGNPEDARYVSPGGGFGPVADDGYGVSYMLFPEDRIYFHVTSKEICAATSASRFADTILNALDDLASLYHDNDDGDAQ